MLDTYRNHKVCPTDRLSYTLSIRLPACLTIYQLNCHYTVPVLTTNKLGLSLLEFEHQNFGMRNERFNWLYNRGGQTLLIISTWFKPRNKNFWLYQMTWYIPSPSFTLHGTMHCVGHYYSIQFIHPNQRYIDTCGTMYMNVRFIFWTCSKIYLLQCTW